MPNDRVLDELEQAAQSIANKDDQKRMLEAIDRTKQRLQQGTPISEFFSQVGEGLLNTQRALDAKSERYVREVKDNKLVAPAMFRIPRLKGELKFGLTTTSSQEINLLFFEKEEEQRRYQEQRLEFEMVSMPAPPEALSFIESRQPRLSLVLDPAERARIVRALRDALAAGGERFEGGATLLSQARALLGVNEQGDPVDRILLVGLGEERTLVARAREDAFDRMIAFWFFDGTTIRPFIRVEKVAVTSPPPAYFGWLSELEKAQADYLGILRG